MKTNKQDLNWINHKKNDEEWSKKINKRLEQQRKIIYKQMNPKPTKTFTLIILTLIMSIISIIFVGIELYKLWITTINK